MKKIISMLDFVLEQDKKIQLSDSDNLETIILYAHFLKQPLEIWMFVPCELIDGVWVVLEDSKFNGRNFIEVNRYQQAKKRCLFEDFIVDYYELGGGEITTKSSFQVISKDGNIQICNYKARPKYFIWNYQTIEDLGKLDLQLTQTSLKQIGL